MMDALHHVKFNKILYAINKSSIITQIILFHIVNMVRLLMSN
jgi:hypothetical protein